MLFERLLFHNFLDNFPYQEKIACVDGEKQKFFPCQGKASGSIDNNRGKLSIVSLNRLKFALVGGQRAADNDDLINSKPKYDKENLLVVYISKKKNLSMENLERKTLLII